MKAKVNGSEYEMRFRYGVDGKRKVTVCEVTKVVGSLENGKLDRSTEAVGLAECSPKDQFQKSVGRAISLGRALKELGNEEVAEELRKAYHNRK